MHEALDLDALADIDLPECVLNAVVDANIAVTAISLTACTEIAIDTSLSSLDAVIEIMAAADRTTCDSPLAHLGRALRDSKYLGPRVDDLLRCADTW